MGHTKTITVNYLARVEGEGALYVKFDGSHVQDLQLKIFEPPRFFEAFLRNRNFMEAPDITARICGICPVAYQMSSVHAMEDALDITLPKPLRELRRLLYCAEWIESHALHIYMLHAPDFLDYPSAIEMAKDHPTLVENGLKLKKIGNALMSLIGGREIHPINVKVGGFYKIPSVKQLRTLRDDLLWAKETAKATVYWAGTLPMPEFNQDYEFVALSHPSEYPLNEGRLVSNKGLDISIKDYTKNFVEEHVEHSNALHSIHKGHGSYLVGPMARYSLNYNRLSDLAQDTAKQAGLSEVCSNPFQSIIVRAVEVLYACEEALRIIDEYTPPDTPCIELTPKSAVGYACTEAPRGILYHQYQIDSDGSIQEAKIVPPTSQNQKRIEDDLVELIKEQSSLPDDELQYVCEQAIRNYDPCISCATHFLKIQVER